jgi:hypothetical protein
MIIFVFAIVEYAIDIISASHPRDFQISVEVLINGKKATWKNIPYSEQ